MSSLAIVSRIFVSFLHSGPIDVRIWKFETPRILSFNSEKDLNPFSTIIIFWEKIYFTIDVAMSSNIILT